jgi:hypothetical protein
MGTPRTQEVAAHATDPSPLLGAALTTILAAIACGIGEGDNQHSNKQQ